MNKWLLIGVFFITCLLFSQNSFGQGDPKLVQVTGMVLAEDSISPVIHANIYTPDKSNGTTTNLNGYFTMVAAVGDTVEFSAIGYVTAALIVPKDLPSDSYSLIHYMHTDTLLLPEAVIYPWPTKIEFKTAFLELELPDDDIKRAQRNLEAQKIREMQQILAYDGNENFDNYMRDYSRSLYSKGQIPYQPIFNVFSWVEFFKALKEGKFKNKNKYINKPRNGR